MSNSDTRTVTNVGGETYPTRHYYRAPTNYTGTVDSPMMDYDTSTWANEPWVYLNLFVSGSISVSKVRFTGSNFEIDNLTVTSSTVNPTNDLVLVKNIYEAPLEEQTITWEPTNTTFSEPDPQLTPNQSTSSSGPGAISYEVVEAGTAGCTVDSITDVITRTSMGTCVVGAVADAVDGSHNSGFKDVTLTFTRAPGSTRPTDNSSTVLADTGFEPFVALCVGAQSLLIGAGAMHFTRRKRS